MAHEVFISYRNSISKNQAQILKGKIDLEFGMDTAFLDNDDLQIGTKWATTLKEKLKAAKIVIVIIGPKWVYSQFNFTDAEKDIFEGSRRIDYKEDWVCWEIEAGHAEKKAFPVYMGGAEIGEIDSRAMPKNKPYLKDFFKDVQGCHISKRQKKHEFVPIFDEIKKVGIPPNPSEVVKPKLADHHQYTCNRNEQYEDFCDYVLASNEERRQTTKIIHKKLNFFFIYGGNKQAQQGLYQRFHNRLNGKYRDFEDNYMPSSIKVKDNGQFQFPNQPEEKRLKKSLVYEFFKSLGFEDYIIEPILEKNLAFAIEHNPTLSSLTTTDRCCFFIRISGNSWNKAITPKITKWFIEEFCAKELPESVPNCYFFFSVDYRDRKAYIKDEIEEALAKAEYTIKLPPLDMVNYEDIEDWFDTYQDVWEEEMETVMAKHFKEKEEELYMKDVQFTLKTIINETNNPSEKRAHRGRGNN